MGPLEPAEVFRLVLLVLLLPSFVVLARRLRRTPGGLLTTAAFVLICLSWVADLFDAETAVSIADAIQHVSLAVAGLLSLAGMIAARRAVLARGDRS